MAIQQINLGTYANDGTGDDLRTAFEKVNANFSELSVEVNITNGANIGTTGVGIFAQRNGFNLEFKKLKSSDGSVAIVSSANSVDLSSISTLSNDPSPQLNSDLDLNGYNIINGGDLRTTVFGYSVSLLSSIVESLITTNQINIDFGTFEFPKTFNNEFDMGTFSAPLNVGNNIDFGNF